MTHYYTGYLIRPSALGHEYHRPWTKRQLGIPIGLSSLLGFWHCADVCLYYLAHSAEVLTWKYSVFKLQIQWWQLLLPARK